MSRIAGVMWNFLGTYMSRYSEHYGFWLFGFLVPDLGRFQVDLMEDADANAPLDGPRTAACRLARAKFREQLQKARVVCDELASAQLIFIRSPAAPRAGCAYWQGYAVDFVVDVAVRDSRRFQRSRRAFVAPHDPATERRSARADR